MAAKTATVYVVDLGSTMAECHNGRVESDLDYGMKYVWNKIAGTMSENKTSLAVGVVGFRTDDTDNKLGEGYENICVLKDLGPVQVEHFSSLREKLVVNETEDGDAISAVVVAIDMIEKFTTLKSGLPGKFGRKIVLLTDGQGDIEDEGDDIKDIAKRLDEIGIELLVIGVDFDDSEFGFKEEDKSSAKRNNETILKNLTEGCKDGQLATAAEVNESLAMPEIKVPKPYSTYNGRLCLGDIEKYPETAMFIDVVRYFKTHLAKPPGASSYVSRMSNGNEEGTAQSSHTLNGDIVMTDAPVTRDGLSAVRSAFTYKINDTSAPGGKRDVPRDELAKGYEYGRTAVPISQDEENVTKLETKQSFSIIGFVPSDQYDKYLTMGESCVTIAQPVNDKARLGFSSLVHALYELDSYAIARLVKKDGGDPQIICLAPSIEPDLEALIDVPLPFAEDVRVYRFPPLDKVITTSGTTLTKHRYLPSDDLVEAMSDFVDSMDLSTFGRDEEGEPTEYMPIEDTFAPSVHRIKQAIQQRAINPTEPIGPPAEVLMKWSNPPEQLVSKAAPKLKRLQKAADVKKVSPKATGSRRGKEIIKPLSGLDVSSLLNRENRQKISPENAIPEFKQMLSNTTDDNAVIDAANQMAEIVRRLVTESIGDLKYARATENLKVLREQIIEFEMPEVYNDFMRDFKKRLVAEQLGGNRKEFWFDKVKKAKLGLIDNATLEISDVSEEDAREFYSLGSGLPSRGR